MLALVMRAPHLPPEKIQRLARWLFAGGLALMVLVAWASPASTSRWELTAGLSATALMGVGLVALTLHPGPAARLFGCKPLRMLGRYSYGFYVFHLVWRYFWIQVLVWLVGLTHSKALGGLLALPLGFLATLLLAVLSYHLVEQRFLRLKRRFRYDSERQTHQTAFAEDGN